MSKQKKNIYEKKAKQKTLTGLGSTDSHVETKGDFKNTMAFTGRDILIGGLGGSLAGAVAGRLEDLSISATLSIVNNGVQLMNFLSAKSDRLPDMLFLDLNMPLKNGFECLSEIKLLSKFKNLPVIIFTTSFNMEVADLLYQKGAHYYICKPGEFHKLRQVIDDAITLISETKSQPKRDKFILYS